MQNTCNADLVFNNTIKKEIGRALYGPFTMPTGRNLRAAMRSLFNKARSCDDFDRQPAPKYCESNAL